jgi:2-dehydropantoate 2-reductase
VRVLVVGAGAIGGILGGYMAAGGVDVTCADGWPEHVAAIDDGGLRVRGVRGEHRFPVRAVPIDRLETIDTTPDVVFVAVKSYDTAAVVSQIASLLGTETAVVSVQNGVQEEAIAAVVGADRVLGAVTEIGGYLDGPGQVVETRADGGFVLGELRGGTTERSERVGELMSLCAPTTVAADIRSVLWSKLAWNCAINALSAVSGIGQGRILMHEHGRRAAFGTIREVAAVADAHGIAMTPLTFLGIDIPALAGPPGPDRDAAEEQVVDRYRSQADKRTSMAEDVRSGRRTEVDHLNGFVVARGQAAAVETPMNTALLALVRAVEGGATTPDEAHLTAVAGAR